MNNGDKVLLGLKAFATSRRQSCDETWKAPIKISICLFLYRYTCTSFSFIRKKILPNKINGINLQINNKNH